MNRIVVLESPAAGEILTKRQGFDLDHDGQREFAYRSGITMPGEVHYLEFYECIADNTFVLAHVLDLENSANGNDLYVLADAGDIDQDGNSDLVIHERDHVSSGVSAYAVQVYESLGPDMFPTHVGWEAGNGTDGWTSGGLIADTDGDGQREISVAVSEPVPGGKLTVYECAGDDSYDQSWFIQPLPGPISLVQSMRITADVDADGSDEVLIGGVGRLIAVESIGNNAYEHSWTWTFSPTVNTQLLIDGGDLDGDGRREFLAGGLKPNAPLQSHFHVFEAIADDLVEIVFTHVLPASADGYSSANVADVDGDGRKEIVFATGSVVKILQNVGNDAWHEIWSGVGGSIQAIGAGDHDQDGKDEIIFRTGGITNGTTSIWEIDPAYQADMDGDDRVDVIDNCPMDFNPGQEDADLDAVGDACDNCLHGPNPGQGLAPLGQTIVGAGLQTFSWPLAADVVYVRGHLAEVGVYGFGLVDLLPQTTSLTDLDVPAVGSGFWYLLRPDCPVGSWQSTIGAEPGRDAALP